MLDLAGPAAMRIAFLTHEPFHPPSGGGSAEALYLVRELVARGHAVHVFSPPAADPQRVEAEFGVRLHPFTRWRMGRYTRFRNVKYALYPTALGRLVERTAATTRFDLVLAQHAISCVAAGRLKHRLRVPVVMNFLDYLTGFMETWPVWLMPPPILAVLKRYELSLPRRFQADGVMTVSDPLADCFAGTGYPRDRLRPIYYGYDAALFPWDDRVVAVRRDAPPTLVMHGSFDHHHLGPIALGALERVRAARPDARLRLVGKETPALERFRRAAAARGLAAGIEAVGFRPYAEVAQSLADATVGIVPYEESTGVHCAFVAKVVEYLALGLPVVCTPLRAIQRYFKDEPLVKFSAFDGSDFGAQILAWLAEPATRRAAFAAPAARRVRTELDWVTLCRRAVDFIETVASTSGVGKHGRPTKGADSAGQASPRSAG